MTKARAMVVLLFLVAFAAGVTSGLVAGRPKLEPPPRRGPAAELNLTPDQDEQMKKAWAGVGWDHWRKGEEKRRALAKQRDEAITGLIPEERRGEVDRIQQEHGRQMGEYPRLLGKQRDEAVRNLIPEDRRGELDRIQEDYSRQAAELATEGRKANDEAVAKTKTILTEEQFAKWEQMTWRRGFGPGRRGRGPETAPATQPVDPRNWHRRP